MGLVLGKLGFEVRVLEGPKSGDIVYYARASDLADVRAKASLAVLATDGMLESIPNFALGARLLREAVAKTNDAEYIFKLAQMTEQGRVMPPDPVEAAKLYQRAAAFGSAEALGELATLTLSGEGVARDPVAAKAMYEKAAGAGDPVAYVDLAILARRHNDATQDPADLEVAGRWVRRGAEAGEAHSMNMYARDLLLGQEGFAKHFDGALGWFGKSLAHGNDSAADTLQAIVTDTTLPVSQKVRDDALLLLVKSATLDSNALATHALQVIWQARDGVDMAKAPKAALEALLGGPEHAMIALLLGEAYADGRFDGMPDAVDAKWYLEMAAAAGEAHAGGSSATSSRLAWCRTRAPSERSPTTRRAPTPASPARSTTSASPMPKGSARRSTRPRPSPRSSAPPNSAMRRRCTISPSLTRAAPARRSRPTTPPNGFSTPRKPATKTRGSASRRCCSIGRGASATIRVPSTISTSWSPPSGRRPSPCSKRSAATRRCKSPCATARRCCSAWPNRRCRTSPSRRSRKWSRRMC